MSVDVNFLMQQIWRDKGINTINFMVFANNAGILDVNQGLSMLRTHDRTVLRVLYNQTNTILLKHSYSSIFFIKSRRQILFLERLK